MSKDIPTIDLDGDPACPKCGEECWRESADVGVGVIYGPYGCTACGWSEDPRYDCSEGPREENGGWVTPQGGWMRKGGWCDP